MENSTETWVYGSEAIQHVNETGECVCGTSEPLVVLCGEWGGWYKWCNVCERSFALLDDMVLSPDTILHTEEEGLVDYRPEFGYELGVLISMSGYVEDYIELSPPRHGEVVLYAQDGLLVGYLIYDKLAPNDPFLRALGVADGYRFEGYGTEFLEQWFETIEEDTLNVMAAEDTHGFYERLSFPVEF